MGELTVIHMVRHGEVDNPSGELYGRQEGFHLTPLGRRMAGKVADFFEGHDIRTVISSPLERARETAAPTAQMHGLPIRADVRIIEAGNKFEGINVNRNRLILAKPRYWPWYINVFEPSWGEPYKAIVARFSAAIRDALSIAEGGEAVLVSHQLPIWTMRSFVERRSLAHDPRRRQCSLCSVTSLTYVGRQLIAVDYAEPAIELLRQARDVTPGRSEAEENTGE
ncbi:MAG: histidine phosphatase family protein [Ancrocorticia sp.]|jgi:broad specificity phosphatase PhoE|nr:histidine phosphatase family protein [Ancrocorticia sp.]MCI1895573.1 histidine phosphatase family protein [Ancrocorticia sp.]MCI1932322.1 histidine phosphatase family protein [Ancrocorticia sp.]MCI1962783.1 histidine phosphatase family protein [Ancrocorticia sp.]MCI2001937.1 histidine phosphatase family protein [Ancrocorticia sp.]